MKRKQTEFERLLVENGWSLVSKTYTGKLAKRVANYIYEKEECGYTFKLVINPKRDNMIDLRVQHNYYYLGFYEMNQLQEIYDDVFASAKDLLKQSQEEKEKGERTGLNFHE